jgi:uncharacterized protein involved in exopolysaccharide biosynthesis
MIANRTLDLDDFLTMARRHLMLILFSPLLALAAGFSISFAFSPRYTSVSLVGVERQTVNLLPGAPWVQVRSIVTPTMRERMMTLQQRVLNRSQLQALVNRLGLARGGKSVDGVIDKIQSSIAVSEADPPGTPPPTEGPSGPLKSPDKDPSAFSISVTADNPRDAQQICSGLTSALLAENLKSREQAAENTTDFLSRQLADAKNDLDEKERAFAAFKSLYLGQLPSDVEDNLKISGELKSQLDADTQLLNRMQQDKSYTESLLAQQLSAWKSSQTFRTSETIEQRMAALQTQLVALQAQYTEDHPEIIKMRRDIAALEAKQKEMNARSDQKAGTADAVVEADIKEPPEIQQLRRQIHENELAIAKATQEQQQLQETIDKYRSRLTLSPKVEEEYGQLTRDFETAHQIYNSLVVARSQSEIQTDLERQQQGEQLRLVDDANLPGVPSSPDRGKFAVYGFGAGLAFGVCIAMWLEFRDKAIRDERDVLAGLELPMLTNIPWVGPAPVDEQSGFRGRFRALVGQKRAAGADAHG